MNSMKNVVVAAILLIFLVIATSAWAETSTLKLTSPNGGEILNAGSTYTISWTYAGEPGSLVKVVLLKGSVTYRALSVTAPIGSAGSGSFDWKVPATLEARSDYKIRVASASRPAINDLSDSTFMIMAPPAVVSADNVLISRSNNALKSSNLQSALDNEMAIDLAQLLRGSTWTIVSKGIRPEFTASGQVTFLDKTLTVDSGTFAAVWLMSDYSGRPCKPTTDFFYETINNSTLFIRWDYACDGFDANYKDHGTLTVFANSTNEITMIGHGGTISVLTKAQGGEIGQ